jgi:hypothetical protein
VEQNTRLKWGSAAFGVFWVVFMAVSTSDGSPAHLAILAVSGVLVAACWYWAMKRFMAWCARRASVSPPVP